MSKNLYIRLFLFLAILITILLGACAPAKPAEETTLRLALLPILEAIPMHVAQQEGYFAEEGLKVEIIPVSSAAERDQVIAAGQADGMVNDLVSTLLYNQETPQIQIVSFAQSATSEVPQYRILASGESGLSSVADLKGVEIGISEGSVINYITDRILHAEGFTQEEIKTIAVPKIPDRLSLLDSGELKAATLPDPFGTLAIQSGASLIIDDSSYPQFGNSEISFRKEFIDENPEAVRGFLKALDKAIAVVNADPTKYEDLLVEQKLIPAPLVGNYKIPPFPRGQIPSESQWADVLAWAQEKGLISGNVSYSDSVTGEFLP
jgi:NitT/TauT family transport system substrate-binding protein